MIRPIAAVLVSLAAAGSASADLIQITASGPINASNMTAFPVGQSVMLTFTYESAGAPQLVSNQQAFHVDHWRSIHIVSGAWDTQDNDAFGQINKYDGLGGTDGIQFQAAANQATYQFTNPKPQAVQLSNVFSNNLSQAFDNMYCNFAANNNAVWSDYTLPTTYDFSLFNQTKNMSFAFSNGSFQVGITNVTSQVLPAPGSVALLALGGLVAGRRKRS